MHPLLLVSIQAKIITMQVYEINLDLISHQTKNKNVSQVRLNKEKILCNHCKRTASNGIRCLGICVADNDY